MSNRIPRKFNRIVGRILINTNMTKANDILHVYKNDSDLLLLNTRTQKRATCFISMLRNNEIFELISVE